ncbi:MAG TPA: DUF2232 domain-containing protein [Bacillota bacterium]|nr:DUF2232 domain-containing protein [Bacillota bacterium]
MTAGEKTRALTEWALFTSLAVIVGLAGIYFPPFYLPAAVCFPVPFILLVVRLDSRYGLAGLTVAGLLIAAAVPVKMAALVLVLQDGLLGMLYGLLFKNRVPSGRIISAGIAVSVVLAFSSAGLIYGATGANPFILDQESRQLAGQWLHTGRLSGGTNGVPAELSGFSGENIVTLFETLLPGQFVVTSAATGAVVFFIGRMALRRYDFYIPPAASFTGIYLPWYSIWGLIFGLGLILAGDFFSLQPAAKTGMNILFVLFYVYLVLGFSVAAYFFLKVRLARPLKVFLLFTAFVYFPFSVAILLFLGAIDPLVNFRRFPVVKE